MSEKTKTAEERIHEAVGIGFQFGSIDGAHHKMWVIDQMLRVLLQDKYADFVKEVCNGEDGPETYEWDEGIAP